MNKLMSYIPVVKGRPRIASASTSFFSLSPSLTDSQTRIRVFTTTTTPTTNYPKSKLLYIVFLY